MSTFSPTIDRALSLSATAHRHQERKGSQVPYIIHPVHVAILLLRHDFPEEVIVAALLHDVVEDTTLTIEDIARHRRGPHRPQPPPGHRRRAAT